MLAVRYTPEYACSFFLCHLPNLTFLPLQAFEINVASVSLRDRRDKTWRKTVLL